VKRGVGRGEGASDDNNGKWRSGEWADGHKSYHYSLLDIILLPRAVRLLGVVI